MVTSTTNGFLGAGLSYRSRYRAELLGEVSTLRPRALEVIPAHFFAHPPLLEPLAERYPLFFHEVGLSLGTALGEGRGSTVTRELLHRIRELVQIARPRLFSDHLALTRSAEGLDVGHLVPLWYTREALRTAVENIRAWQDILGVPIALENIAAPFVVPEAELSEPEFFSELVTATGCGMLLDLTNLLVNAKNFGFDPVSRLHEYPLGSVLAVHLAGARPHGGWWVDGHDAPVEEASFELLQSLRSRAPLQTIIIERDAALPPLETLLCEAQRAEEIWRR
jgi:uncharacterized protein (UPF0276 family)